MRRIFLRQRTTRGDDLAKLFGERKPNANKPNANKLWARKPLTDLKAFGAVMSFFVGLAAAGFAAFALLAWLAWESHEFGPRDPRYLLFIRGTLIERVGIIDAQPGTLVYGGQGRDGTAPGYARARYTSSVEASALLARFVERCKALGLHVKLNDQTSPDGSRSASCGRKANDDFHVGITVREGHPTEVTMGEDFDDGL